MKIGDPCWRDASGVAAMELPWRVYLPDGTPRTDPSQWSQEPEVLAVTGWHRSTLNADDVEALTPPAPAVPVEPSWQTPAGWSLYTTPGAVSLLTGLYVLAARREQLGQGQTISVTDTAGERHSLTFAEFDAIMLAYGKAVEEQHGAA